MADAFHYCAGIPVRRLPGLPVDHRYQLLHLIDFDEMDFVVAGPGARDGICKCFGPEARGVEAELISYVSDTQEQHFTRLGLSFSGLMGAAGCS